jgi:hypothetical protein
MRLVVLTHFMILLATVPAGANQIIVDTNGPTRSGATGFGNPLVTNLGQAFIAPQYGTDPTLNSFGFYLQGPSTETMIGSVYAWNGKAATGPALYTSPVEALAGTGGFDLIEFNTGGIPLVTGQQYILIASTANVPTSVGQSTLKSIDAPWWLGGLAYVQQSGNNFNQIFTPTWFTFGSGSATAIRAVFSGTNISFVPEPDSLILASIAVIAEGAFMTWKRHHKSNLSHDRHRVLGKKP